MFTHKVPRIAKREFSLSIHWASSWDIPALFLDVLILLSLHEDNKHKFLQLEIGSGIDENGLQITLSDFEVPVQFECTGTILAMKV